MGGSASLLHIPHELLNETEAIKGMGVTKSSVEHLQLSSEVLANIRRRSRSESQRIEAKRKAERMVRYEVPSHVKTLLEKIGIRLSQTRKYHSNTKKLVAHIFECLDGLQHLVRADQDSLPVDEMADQMSETQSVVEANKESVGRLLHEMITIYTLCGDTVRVLLQSNPDAAKVEDNYGRLPLHVAVDRDQPWTDAIDRLVTAYPQALNRRDGGGRLPLHIAVDRQEPNVEVVRMLLAKNPHTAMARRGVGRLPLHYAIFAEKPNLEVINELLGAAPEGARTADVYGRLPLHYAVDKAVPNLAVVQCLLRAYPEGAAIRDSHLKLPLTIALERDNIDLQVVRRLYEAYPQALAERGGAGGGSVGSGGSAGSKLPLQILVENYLHAPHANLFVIDFIARMHPAAILSVSDALKRDSPMLLALDRNIFEVSRRFLILCPTYNPTLLRNANWRARKIAFLLARRQIFRPSVLQRLAQLAIGGSGKSGDSPNPGNVSPTSSLRLFHSALSSVTATAATAGSSRTSMAHLTPAQSLALLRDVNAAVKPRRRKNSGGSGGGRCGAGAGANAGGGGDVASFSPASSPTFGEFKPLPSLFYAEQLHLPHLTAVGLELGAGAGPGAGAGLGAGLSTWSGEELAGYSPGNAGVDVHNIYDSPSSRPSMANSPRGAANVNFYLRLYKTNSDAFRLAVMYL